MPAFREQHEERARKMSLALLEAYVSGQVCGFLYGYGANGHSAKEVVSGFRAGMVQTADLSAQKTSLSTENLTRMMGISRSGYYDLLKKAQTPLLNRNEDALRFEVLTALESTSTHGGADLVWLQRKFVDRNQGQDESEAAYRRRVAAEEARIENIVEWLFKQNKIEQRSRSNGSIRYYATDVTLPADDPAATETMLKTFRLIVGSLIIAALEQHHSGKKNGALYRYKILRLRDEPAAREVLQKARELLQEFDAKLEELKQEYMCKEDPTAEPWVNLNLILGRVIDYDDDLAEEARSEISKIHSNPL